MKWLNMYSCICIVEVAQLKNFLIKLKKNKKTNYFKNKTKYKNTI